MAAASLSIVPASGNITAKRTVCRVTVADAPANTVTGYDATKYPGEPQVVYVLTFACLGTDTKKSERFSTDSAGGFVFDNFIFDKAGSWTLDLLDTADDSQIATASVTVS